MAEHYNPGLLPRTYFRAPRVPFDFRALALAILAFLIYWAGGHLISEVFRPSEGAQQYDVPGGFLAWAFQLFGDIPFIGRQIGSLLTGALRIDPGNLDQYGFWELLVGGIWFVGVWSFFAQGIHRITTLRIARDEGLSLVEALKFSAKNWPTMLLAPVIIACVIGIFFACNMLAGLALSIPVAGGILGLVAVPLAFVSTLLILLVGVGGILGLPLIGAAAAWECNGSLDAISRAFSYLFARPLQYFWNFFLIFLFTGIILLVGGWFTFTFAKSIDAGALSEVQTLMVDPPARRVTEESDWAKLSGDSKELYKDMEIRGRERRAPAIETPAKDIQTVGVVPWTYKLNALIFWFFFNLIWLAVAGYALYWLIGASTSVYADLRQDVDGTEEDEVFIEEEEQDLDALAEGGPAVEGGAAAESSAGEESPAANAPAEAAPETPADEPADEPATPEAKAPEASAQSEASEPEAPSAPGSEAEPEKKPDGEE